jgi:hypothetical protein
VQICTHSSPMKTGADISLRTWLRFLLQKEQRRCSFSCPAPLAEHGDTSQPPRLRSLSVPRIRLGSAQHPVQRRGPRRLTVADLVRGNDGMDSSCDLNGIVFQSRCLSQQKEESTC